MSRHGNEHPHSHAGADGREAFLGCPVGAEDRDLEYLAATAASNNWRNTEKSIDLALEFHDGQRRLTGEPYVTHPLAVAGILLAHGVGDDVLVASALLHDVLEECSDRVTADDLATVHGLDARVVATVTALTKAPAEPNHEYYARISASGDAILVKAADRTQNLQTMADVYTPAKVKRKVAETREFVLPLREQGITLSPKRSVAFKAVFSRMESTLARITVE